MDEDYSRLWSATDMPDLNNIHWSDINFSGWQTSTLTVYLENKGGGELEVSVSDTENPYYARPGFSVSSDEILIKPNERRPLFIEISRNPRSLSLISSAADIETLYFKVNRVSQDIDITILITTTVILVCSAGWVLHQKGRNYGWLILSPTVIGIIIIFCLENRRRISEDK